MYYSGLSTLTWVGAILFHGTSMWLARRLDESSGYASLWDYPTVWNNCWKLYSCLHTWHLPNTANIIECVSLIFNIDTDLFSNYHKGYKSQIYMLWTNLQPIGSLFWRWLAHFEASQVALTWDDLIHKGRKIVACYKTGWTTFETI